MKSRILAWRSVSCCSLTFCFLVCLIVCSGVAEPRANPSKHLTQRQTFVRQARALDDERALVYSLEQMYRYATDQMRLRYPRPPPLWPSVLRRACAGVAGGGLLVSGLARRGLGGSPRA